MLETLTEILGPEGPLIAVGVLGVFLVLLSLPVFLRRGRDPFDRLREQSGQAAGRESRQDKPARGKLRRADATVRLGRLGQILEPKDEEELSALRLRLMQAGYRQKAAVRMYHFLQMVLGLGGLVLGVLYIVIAMLAGKELSPTLLAGATLVPGCIGYYLPKYWVTRRIQERQSAIERAFPDSLDLLLVCVEAGQSLDQAINRVAEEIATGFPELADEYSVVAQEMKAGKDKIQVLRDFAARCGVADVASFVTVLIQSQTFGTSIADALRVYAAEMRDKRVMRAEEKANVLPTKLTLGTMMFTVPPLLIILIGPSIYDIYVNLLGGGGGVGVGQ